MGHFVNGLREDIRAEIRMLGLHSLEQAMDLALKVEEKNRTRNNQAGEGMAQYSASFKLGPNSQFSLYSKKSEANVLSSPFQLVSKTSSYTSKTGSTTSS